MPPKVTLLSACLCASLFEFLFLTKQTLISSSVWNLRGQLLVDVKQRWTSHFPWCLPLLFSHNHPVGCGIHGAHQGLELEQRILFSSSPHTGITFLALQTLSTFARAFSDAWLEGRRTHIHPTAIFLLYSFTSRGRVTLVIIFRLWSVWSVSLSGYDSISQRARCFLQPQMWLPFRGKQLEVLEGGHDDILRSWKALRFWVGIEVRCGVFSTRVGVEHQPLLHLHLHPQTQSHCQQTGIFL